MKSRLKFLVLVLLAALTLAACGGRASTQEGGYVLTTALRDGKLVYVGVGSEIAGQVNPSLEAKPGEKVTVTLINGEGAQHDLFLPDLDAKTSRVTGQGNSTSVTFTAPTRPGSYKYMDSVPGHAEAGMQGYLLVGGAQAPAPMNGMDMNASSAVQPTGVTVEYHLESAMQDGKMVFLGKGGDIDGKANPDLKANPGDTLKVTLTSGDGAQHNIFFEAFNAKSPDVMGQGNSVTLEFTPDRDGTFVYYCAVPGHRQAGMEGKLIVGTGVQSSSNTSSSGASIGGAAPAAAVPAAGPANPDAVDITRDPTDLPAPIGARGPEKVRVDLETTEVAGKLADGTTYTYWTFNGKVPGPFIRVRVGDTVEVHLKNAAGSTMNHSVDFHATTGPGGGAVATQTQPGQETHFTFQALNPGLFVYHCATPMVADHIANGMYGLILVEPEGGLPKVDREFYVMQGELYTAQPFGTAGQLTSDTNKLLDEHPEYFVFNGASMALTSEAHSLKANVGETVRIFFGVGGPNFTSSFHVIGEIFDRVYDQASLTANPLTDVQTTLVPPGGATMVEFSLQVPGRYILVDHALSRMQRGLAGYLIVSGPENKSVFDAQVTPGSGH
ncbi:MAG: copper-containing nitrite reductase [Bacteroidota bacterium]